MPVRTWVGRFAIVDGQAREEGPFLRSFPRQRPDEEEDELYVLVEPASHAARPYCDQLVDAIGRVFKQDILSTTGAMLRALRSANQQLRDWNERTLREHRVFAGSSCLAIRGRSAFLAQFGPSIAYHLGDGVMRRIEPDDDSRAPLGEPDQLQPVIQRFQLAPGDIILTASSSLDSLADEGTMRSLLTRGGDEALVELFRLARGEQEFSLVLLTCVAEPEGATPATDEALPVAVMPSGGEPVAAGAVAESAEAGPGQFAAPAGLAVAAAAQQATAAAGPENAAEETLPDTLEVAVQAEDEPMPTAPAALEPKVRLKGAEHDMRYRRSTGIASRIPRIPPLAIVGAAVLIVAVVLAIFLLPSALQSSKDDEFSNAISDASAALATAQATTDPAAKREALSEADQRLGDAEEIRSGDPDAAELRTQIDQEVAKLDAIVELPPLELVAELSERVPGSISAKDMVIGGGGAYILDREQQRVIAVSLIGAGAEPFVLYQAGALVGTEVTGAPQHIAWAEDLNALLVLDDSRRLLAVTPPGQPIRQLVVRDATAWGSADGIAYQQGTLYVLDRSGDQIWRYIATENGFDSEREPLITGVDLDPALEMAIGDAVYLVMADSSIMRVDVGSAAALSQAGIDRPLSSPASLIYLPGAQRILVADRGNARIVAFVPDGAFQQQWVSPTFTDLRSIAADEPGGLMYILNGGALYRTAIPPPPQ